MAVDSTIHYKTIIYQWYMIVMSFLSLLHYINILY